MRWAALILVWESMTLVALAGPWVALGPQPITTGPYTGRIAAVAPSPDNPNLYYIGAATGGVWRTLDGGAHWQPLTDHLPTCAIGALAVDPRDDQVVYAGSGEANFAQHSPYGLGLYKSVDGGDHWAVLATETFAGRTFSRLVISAADSAVLYAAVTRAGGFPALMAAKGHPLAEGPVGLLRSADAGETWTLLSGGLPQAPASDLAVDPRDPDTLYAAIGDIFGSPDNGIYKSTDAGARWTRLGGGLPASPGRIALAVAPADARRLYAFITWPASPSGGSAITMDIYRSDDAGQTWSPTGSGNLQNTYGWYLCTLIVDPQDPDTFFAGGVPLVRSNNGGGTYDFVAPPHVDIHGLAFDAGHRLLCADDGGVHRSPDGGQTWTALNDTLSAVQFYAGLSVHPTDPDLVLGGTQDNGTNLRREPGTAWSRLIGGDGGCTAIQPDQPQTMFAEYQGTGLLFRTADGGQTFQHSAAGICFTDRNCFLPPYTCLSGNNGVMLYATQRIYRSIDSGLSWAPVSADLTAGPPAAIRALAAAPADQDTVYAVTTDGRLLVSTDGGYSWELRLTGVDGWPRITREVAVDPLDAQRAYLAAARFGGQQVRRTTDLGQTWEVVAGDLPDVPANTVAIQNPGFGRMLWVGTDAGVYTSCDEGRRWLLFGRALPSSPVVDLVIDLPHRRVVAATLGRGAWTLPLPALFDHDGSGRVDLRDYAALQACFSGPADGPVFTAPSSACLVSFDLDADDAVDLSDHARGLHLMGF